MRRESLLRAAITEDVRSMPRTDMGAVMGGAATPSLRLRTVWWGQPDEAGLRCLNRATPGAWSTFERRAHTNCPSWPLIESGFGDLDGMPAPGTTPWCAATALVESPEVQDHRCARPLLTSPLRPLAPGVAGRPDVPIGRALAVVAVDVLACRYVAIVCRVSG
jgi:hypothetical protein